MSSKAIKKHCVSVCLFSSSSFFIHLCVFVWLQVLYGAVFFFFSLGKFNFTMKEQFGSIKSATCSLSSELHEHAGTNGFNIRWKIG